MEALSFETYFDKIDDSHDNQLTWGEFLDFYAYHIAKVDPASLDSQAPGPKNVLNPEAGLDTRMLERLREIFGSCDVDGDGTMSKKELIKYCQERPLAVRFFGIPPEELESDYTTDDDEDESEDDEDARDSMTLQVRKHTAGGLGLSVDGEPPGEVMTVVGVDKNSWAESEGVQVGDELVMINNDSVVDLTQKRVFEQLSARPVGLIFERFSIGSGGLPHGWESAKDPASGKTYYFDRATGVTQWTPP